MKTLRTATLSGAVLDAFSTISLAAVAVMLGFRLVDGSIALLPALFVLVIMPDYFRPIREFASDYHATLNGKNTLTQVLEVLGAPLEPKRRKKTARLNCRLTPQIRALARAQRAHLRTYRALPRGGSSSGRRFLLFRRLPQIRHRGTIRLRKNHPCPATRRRLAAYPRVHRRQRPRNRDAFDVQLEKTSSLSAPISSYFQHHPPKQSDVLSARCNRSRNRPCA